MVRTSRDIRRLAVVFLLFAAFLTATATSQPAYAAATRSGIAATANAEVGYAAPGSQCTKYGTTCADWCAMFATWVWQQAGVVGSPRGTLVATALASWGQENGLFKRRPSGARGNPLPGDFAVYGEPGSGVGGHVSVVYSVNNDGSITTIDGNYNNKVVKRTINPVTARAGSRNVLISGYVAPPGISDDPPPPVRVRSVVTANGGQEFGIGPDGHVMSTFWSPEITDNGGWHAWFAIPTGYGDGVTAVNASVAVTTLNGQMQLFTTAADGQVISTFWSPTITTNGGWHAWFAIPTGFYNGKTAPNAVITANGGQLFTTAPDGHVMSTFWSPEITDNGGWHAWFAIPTGFADGLTAPNATVSMTKINNQVQLFTTANDGHVISTFWSPTITTNGGWHAWFAIPTGFHDGKTATNAVITANGGQLFTTAPDGHVMSTFWSPEITDNGGWHAWFAIPTGYADGVAAASTAVAVATINGQTQLFTVAAGGHVMSTFWSASIPTNGGWHEWFAIPTGYSDGVAGAAARVSATTINNQPQIFTSAPDGHVMSTFWSPSITDNGGWHGWFAIPTGFYDGKIRV